MKILMHPNKIKWHLRIHIKLFFVISHDEDTKII